jgi:hypothetical protein
MTGVSMETTVSPKRLDPGGDETVIPLVPQDEKGARDTLAKLAEEAVRATASLRPAVAMNFSAGPRVTAPTPEAAPSVRADDRFVGERASNSAGGGRGAMRFLFAIAIGVGATLAWQSYGQAARQMIAAYVPALAGSLAPAVETLPTGTGGEPDGSVAQLAADATSAHVPVSPPPSPELAQQIETMARDLAALRDGMAKVSTAQDEITRSIARLQEADEAAHRKPTPPPRPAPVRKPVAAVPPPLAAPVAQTPPRSSPAPTVLSTPLPLAAAPPAGTVPEPPRRPPAPMP